jgi:dihydroorotase
MLFGPSGKRDDVVISGVRVVDPVERIDALLDVTVEGGIISRMEPAACAGANASRLLAPAFIDAHVHLRTPGREDEETVRSGTEAAAAGGYCAVLAMPNTEPVVDSAAVLGALAETARAEAAVPVGFLAAISKAQAGAELAELGELAEAGAAGFSDDGRPLAAAGRKPRAHK